MVNTLKSRSLTIGIPTLGRPDSLDYSLGQIFSQVVDFDYKVIISDNNSSMLTSRILKKYYNLYPAQLSYISHNKLLSFKKNLFSLILACSTDYVCIMSDEDNLSLNELQKALVSARSDSNFISPVVTDSKKIARGLRTNSLISTRHILTSAFYLSGLIFKTKYVKIEIEYALAKSSSEILHVYPQVALGTKSILERKAEWSPFTVAEFRDQNPSRIFAMSGAPYDTPMERVSQAHSLQNFLSSVANRCPQGNMKARWNYEKARASIDIWVIGILMSHNGPPSVARQAVFSAFFGKKAISSTVLSLKRIWRRKLWIYEN